MSVIGQNDLRQMYVGLDYPTHLTLAALKAGTIGDIALLSATGSAVAADTPFKFFQLTADGIVSSDVVDPANVLYSKSAEYVAPTLGNAVISGITVDANTLYTVETVISDFGSGSGENEYVKKAFHKGITGDTLENIVDGLVRSSARNFSREEPRKGTTRRYRLKSAAYVDIEENKYFSFEKVTSDGTAEISTITCTQDTDEVGTLLITLDGEYALTYSFASGVTTTNYIIAVTALINDADVPYSAVATSSTVCTITADNKRAETDLVIAGTASNYATDTIPTAATTTPGVDGVVFTFSQTEKAEWADDSFVAGKMDRTNLLFHVDAHFTTLPTITNTKGAEGTGGGKIVASMEWYLKGERNDYMREAGYPHNFNNAYNAVKTSTYSFVEIGYKALGRDGMRSKKSITIAMPVAKETEQNVMITNLNTILGAGSITALSV